MRIAFLGKGGSGKTTVSASFIRFAAGKKPFVLALDADVNAHLAAALPVDGDVLQLGHFWEPVTNYLKGKRVDLGEKPMIMTTPPSVLSSLVRCSFEDDLIKKYALKQGNIALLTVGKYEQSDVGSSCYHGKLSTAVSILHHLLDGADDIVVADNTAGTDAVATSLWFAYDMQVFVVEPTQKSVQVYKDFIALLPQVADKTYVVGNKVEGKEDEEFIRSQIPAEKLLGLIPLSRHLKRFEQGNKESLEQFQTEQSAVFETVLSTLLAKKRDWEAYLKLLREAHAKLCLDWYDAFYGLKLNEGLDSEFNYPAAINFKAPEKITASATPQETPAVTTD